MPSVRRVARAAPKVITNYAIRLVSISEGMQLSLDSDLSGYTGSGKAELTRSPQDVTEGLPRFDHDYVLARCAQKRTITERIRIVPASFKRAVTKG